MRKLFFPLLTLLVLFSACQKSQNLQEGPWRVVMTPDTTRSTLELPLNMHFEKNGSAWTATLTNADEEIKITEVVETKDSVKLFMPIFEGAIYLEKKQKQLVGKYTHNAAGRSWSIPIRFEPNSEERFMEENTPPVFDPTGKWRITMNPGSTREEIQIGEFTADGNHLRGTFLTVIGDYRYLEGKVTGDKFLLSCFDGAHSLLFTADLTSDGQLVNGIFCGGPTWQATWKGEKDESIELPDAGSLTFLKPGYEKLSFNFPDLEGNPVSLDDSRFKNKAVIVQIIGSWCPNCMDETLYFAELYDKYKDQGLEIIALCYESDNFEASTKAIKRFKAGTGANYTFLHAGVANKTKASQTLPMLNRILSYPTSIFIGREGEIQKIFTGFSGPGTGDHFAKLSQEMEQTIKKILED